MDAPTDERRMIEAEVQQVVAAARAALTDEMVSRLATTAGEAIDLMDQVNRAGLARAIPAIAEMVNNGDLNRVARLARVYASAEDALTDEMVGRLAETIAEGMLEPLDSAAADTARAPRAAGGFGGLWSMMRDPDNQDALRYLINVGKAMRASGVK